MKKSLLGNISKFLQAIVILLIFQLSVFICQQIVMGLESMLRSDEELKSLKKQLEERYYNEEPDNEINSADKNITPQGEIHLVNSEYPENSQRKMIIVRDVNMNVLWEGDEEELPFYYVDSVRFSGRNYGRFYSGRWGLFQLGKSVELRIFRDGEAKEFWQFKPSKNIFVGYTNKRQRIGYLGASGFSEDRNHVRSFGRIQSTISGPEHIYYFVSDHRVHAVNFVNHTSYEVFRSDATKIADVRYKKKYVDEDNDLVPKHRPFLYISTENRTQHLLIQEPDEKIIFYLPEDWAVRQIDMAVTDERILLWCQGSYRQGNFQSELLNDNPDNLDLFLNSCFNVKYKEVYEVTSSGELKKLNRFEWKTRFVPWELIHNHFIVRCTPAIVKAFSPLIYKLKPMEEKDSEDGPYAGGMFLWFILSNMLENSQPINLLYCLIASCLCVVLALLHAWSRRTSWTGLAFWIVFVVAFNVAGLLTYLALNHTPVIKCPVCGRKRGLARADCVRCGAELPVPQTREVDRVLIVPATAG